MKKLCATLLFVLLISSVVFAFISFSGNVKAQSGTGINGVISEDSIWTKANSPYTFTGNVTINGGVRLVLEPGVTVNLNGYCFDINGVFSAIGTVDDPVQIIGLGHLYGSNINRISFSGLNNDWNEQTQTGTILENCIVKMALIQVEGVSLKIAHNDFTSVYISLYADPYGRRYSPIISDNVFTSGGIGLVAIGGDLNAKITGNIINNLNSQSAHGINFQGSGTDTSTIEGNYILGARYGICIIRSTEATIKNNFITATYQGIAFLNNTEFPPRTNSTPTISYNNIYSNTYNVFSNRSLELDVTNNWWGTADNQGVSQFITSEDSIWGTVYYSPFLSTSNLQAPPYLNLTAGIGGLTTYPTPYSYPTPVPTASPSPTPSLTPTPAPSLSPTPPSQTPNITPTPIPTPIPTPTSTPTPEPISTPITNQNSTSLYVSCISSTSYSGFNVAINGNLSNNETAVSNAPVLLSYSVNGGKSYQDLTLVNTASDGSFSVSWMPSVTGNYLVKATFEGDTNYPDVSQTVNLAVTQYDQQNIFSVSSNSSVSSLSFNSTSKELSFTVTGDSGTFGFADVFIAKALVQDASSIKVYLDNNNLDGNVVSVEDSWLLHFTYHHSSHNVIVNINSAINQTNDSIDWVVYVAIILAAALTVGTVMVVKHRRHETIP
jgi:hypothetical protein